ncbi:hypothetical protein [Pseudodesulfovibrio sp.]|uniref:hypothetical protein n=1 Tax=unclassified Pseudodesulfovibrio TaxID=2661612 RepID=UPI003AFF8331
MKKTVALVVLLLLLAASSAFAGRGFPLTLAGFTLGQDIDKYSDCCDKLSATPIPDIPFLSEVHLKSDILPGIRGGSLAFANTRDKDRLVRIKLKFHDRGTALFDKLLAQYKKAFGNPDSYQGDTFRNVIAWQWDFSKDGQRVCLVLMWSRDNEIRPGVSIKMTLDSLLDSEYEYFKKQTEQLEKKRGGPSRVQNLNDFIPR